MGQHMLPFLLGSRMVKLYNRQRLRGSRKGRRGKLENNWRGEMLSYSGVAQRAGTPPTSTSPRGSRVGLFNGITGSREEEILHFGKLDGPLGSWKPWTSLPLPSCQVIFAGPQQLSSRCWGSWVVILAPSPPHPWIPGCSLSWGRGRKYAELPPLSPCSLPSLLMLVSGAGTQGILP